MAQANEDLQHERCAEYLLLQQNAVAAVALDLALDG
jgi:hypothetical protein